MKRNEQTPETKPTPTVVGVEPLVSACSHNRWYPVNQYQETCGICGDRRKRTEVVVRNKIRINWNTWDTLIKTKGYSWHEVARKANIHPETCRRWIKTRRVPTVILYAQLCQAMGVEFGYGIEGLYDEWKRK